jgi:hypothetical protein
VATFTVTPSENYLLQQFTSNSTKNAYRRGRICDRDNYGNEDIDRKLLSAKEDFMMLTNSTHRPKNKCRERQNL